MPNRMLVVPAVLAMLAGASAPGSDEAETPAETPKAYVAILNFVTADAADPGGRTPLESRPEGIRLADAIRLRLRRHEEYEVIDRLTTESASGPIGADTEPGDVIELMRERIGANYAVYGTVAAAGAGLRAEFCCIDLRGDEAPDVRRRTLTDRTERARAEISKQLVEEVRGEAEWVPPEYGDEPEPEDLGEPVNTNGDFEDGRAGWDPPDNVSTFLVDGPEERGRILRVRTDLERDPWLRYRRALRLGKADPSDPPEVGRDRSYASLAGLEGVHYRSEFIPAEPGRRYWLTAEHRGPGSAKVFIKGFRATPHAMDGLPESALAELGITPEEFADMTQEERDELIRADAEKHPKRYLRECYRWFLNCKDSGGKWTHFAAPFPPRGGLPEKIEFLQIQIYSYWPPGTYWWDDVHLHAAPEPGAGRPEAEEPED